MGRRSELFAVNRPGHRISPRVSLHQWFQRDVEQRLAVAVGGLARLRVVVLLACVLGLNTVDNASVGAVGADLQSSLGINNTQLGLLVSVSTGTGVLATLPVGRWVDRANRVRLLWGSIIVWALAMFASAAAPDYAALLVTRIALGAVVATATPVVSSLTGDLFPPSERGRIYGFIITGELLGLAFGFIVSGLLVAALGWRSVFALLGVLSVVLALSLRTLLPEPARGGQSWIPPGTETIVTAAEAAWRIPEPPSEEAIRQRSNEVEAEVESANIEPRPGMVLQDDPARRSLRWAVRYVLSVRTNLVLILASGLGYFYLSGLETDVIVYIRGRYDLGQGVATVVVVVIGLGAIIGVLVSGRGADALVHRGRIPARIVVAGAAFLLAVAGFLPAMVLPATLLIGAPLFFVGAIGLGGTNAPVDAARLDIMHSRLWGRAESVRTVIRNALTAIGPITFGYVSEHIGRSGLDRTFAIMLAPLLASGLVLLIRARRTYPRDVATAVASEHKTRQLIA
jgi:predicted MFS family arabinose efflux permease